MIKRYRDEGKAFFQHGNKGRKPVNAISAKVQDDILTLYDNKYYGANFAHYAEMLKDLEDITVSKSYLRELFLKELNR